MIFSLLALAISSVVATEQTSIRLYMPDSGRKDGVYVSLIDVQSGLTTASVDCPANSELGPCWMDEKTITYAPSTLVYSRTFNGHLSYSIDYIWYAAGILSPPAPPDITQVLHRKLRHEPRKRARHVHLPHN